MIQSGLAAEPARLGDGAAVVYPRILQGYHVILGVGGVEVHGVPLEGVAHCPGSIDANAAIEVSSVALDRSSRVVGRQPYAPQGVVACDVIQDPRSFCLGARGEAQTRTGVGERVPTDQRFIRRPSPVNERRSTKGN